MDQSLFELSFSCHFRGAFWTERCINRYPTSTFSFWISTSEDPFSLQTLCKRFVDTFILRSNPLVSSRLWMMRQISRKQSDLKKKLKVTFVGEPGLDMGGLTKEWFLLLIKQIFHENYGIIISTFPSIVFGLEVILSLSLFFGGSSPEIGSGMFVYHKQSRCYWFSTTQSGNLREYNLIGVVSHTHSLSTFALFS